MSVTQMRAVFLPSEFTDFAELVESSMIHVSPTWTLTASHLLQRLDVLRQRIAVRWCGAPSVFAGFDWLDVRGDVGSVAGWVTLTARMVDAHDGTHTVELTASLVATDDGSVPRTLISGAGRTLQVPV